MIYNGVFEVSFTHINCTEVFALQESELCILLPTVGAQTLGLYFLNCVYQ
jgi:hypothetical protein